MQQPVDIKHFSGFMNTDDALPNIGANHHRFAFNGRFRGSGNSLRFENVEGTTLLNNPHLPSGYNECIGGFYDELRQKIYSFSYSSIGLHAIYQYNLITAVWNRVLMVGFNTDGDILGFNLNTPVYAVKMLYGDTIQGDTLYWNNCQSEPCQINIERAIAGSYGTVKRSFIDVIKKPASIVPSVVFENDNTVTVNNFRKNLLQYRVRQVFLNKEKSVTSTRSVIPLPIGYLDTNIDKDPTKNCRVAIVIPTGDSDVTDLEIIAAISGKDIEGVALPNQFSDPFLIASLNKAQLGIPDNDLYTYRFYNNESYIPIDVEEGIQLFDYVPLKALCLEFLNGNVPIYAAITEGFNKSVVTGTSVSSSIAQQTTQYPFIFVASQSGDSAFGSGNIHIVVIGAIVIGDTFNVYTTNEILTYSAASANTNDVITGLALAAVANGFTVVSSDTENLVITKTGESLQGVNPVPVLIPVSDSFVYDRNSRYNYALNYFDEAGRTIGALTSNGMNFQTINYVELTGTPRIPSIEFSISSRPPLHARYYQIVRTKNLSKERKLEWVSDRTYKDATYAYISIESLNVFIEQNPFSKYLAFEPIPNDRIRFYKVLSGSVNTIYTAQDFEIVSQEINPTINAVVYPGQFIKILLPTTSSTFDFGTDAFFNYFIELYTPAKPASSGLELYYEFGERYSIGNPGTDTAYHQGKILNQTSDLSQPATFVFTQGDYYYRPRTINTGNVISLNLGAGTLSSSERLAQTLISQTIPNANYTVAENVTQGSFVNNFNSPGWTINVNTGTIVFTVKGTINVRAVNTTIQNFRIQFYVISGTSAVLYPLATQTGITAGDNVAFTVNTTITMPSNSRAFLVMNTADQDFRLDLVSGNLSISENSKIYTIGVIDSNFSDYFESAINSNGRSWIVDENAAQVFNPALMRWGLAFQPNTNINQANRFKGLNFNEADRSRGSIQIMKVRGDRLLMFFERGVAVTGIYSKFLQTREGSNVVTATDEIITKNNFNFYDGLFGVGNQPTGLVSSKSVDYFIDPVRGYQLRLGNNGLTVISEIYKGQFYIQPLFIPYNRPYVKGTGGKSKIMGYYNYFEEEYVSVLEGGTYNGSEILSYTFSFNEKRNSYCSFFDFHPEWILSGEDITYSWNGGQMYSHTNKAKYANFYGTQYYPSITIPFNDREIYKKTYLSMGYQSNKLWTAPQAGDILTTSLDNPNGSEQISKLKEFNFQVIESEAIAAFMRDINSRPDKRDAFYNGDYLKGVALQLKLTYFGADFAFLYLPYIKYALSAPNL